MAYSERYSKLSKLTMKEIAALHTGLSAAVKSKFKADFAAVKLFKANKHAAVVSVINAAEAGKVLGVMDTKLKGM